MGCWCWCSSCVVGPPWRVIQSKSGHKGVAKAVGQGRPSFRATFFSGVGIVQHGVVVLPVGLAGTSGGSAGEEAAANHRPGCVHRPGYATKLWASFIIQRHHYSSSASHPWTSVASNTLIVFDITFSVYSAVWLWIYFLSFDYVVLAG